MTDALLHAEINLGAIAHNVREFKRIIAPNVKIMPAVKAEGYGHGAVAVSQTALRNGADALGVARIEEGIKLREAGIEAPILIFGYTAPINAAALIEYRLTATVSRLSVAKALSDAARSKGEKITVHVKIDTGMGRIGMLTENVHPGYTGSTVSIENSLKAVSAINQMAGIDLEGIYTHFATADHADKTYTRAQFEIFRNFLDQLIAEGIDIPLKHAANSAAAMELPETHLDLIRPGIAFYGLPPSEDVDPTILDLQPAMSLKAKIISLKNVGPGFKVSYGSTHVTNRETRIAVVPVGYADGFSRHFSSNGRMLVRGRRAPIVGRVCMDLTMIDVGHIPDVELEDEVIIFGSQQGETITADEWAKIGNTINYEIVSALTSRVKRIYKK